MFDLEPRRWRGQRLPRAAGGPCGRSTGGGVRRSKGGPVTRDHDAGHGEDASAAGVEPFHVSVRVLAGTMTIPPHVSKGGDAVGGAYQRRDVLGRVTRSADQPDRRRQLESLGVPAGPYIVLVDGPVIVVS